MIVSGTEPLPTPRADDGGPLRARSSAWRRLLVGESPDSISDVWPVLGELIEVDGRPLREVTFVTEASTLDHEAMVHINGITDSHRTDIGPALLDAIDGTALRTIAYLLPDELVASYRFVTAAAIPRDAGRDRAGWLQIHHAGLPDDRNPRRLPNPLGRQSSVLVGHGATVHTAWSAETPIVREILHETVAPSNRGDATLLRSNDSRDGLLIVFDAKSWLAAGIVDALRRYPRPLPSVLLVPSGDDQQRSALLPHPEQIAQVVDDLLQTLRLRGTVRFAADSVIVSGQSYGGLAAAAIVTTRPDLATTAIVQSGSFHFRAGQRGRAPAGQVGDLVHTMRGALTGRRFIVQAGTEESGMRELAARFTDAAIQAGATVTRRTYSGGHDYAWWRTGLFDALDQVAEGLV